MLAYKTHCCFARLPCVLCSAGKYRPSTASGFVHGCQKSTQAKLQHLYAENSPANHQVPRATFGVQPLSHKALRILTAHMTREGATDRRNLSSRAGVGNQTYLSMTKSTRVRFPRPGVWMQWATSHSRVKCGPWTCPLPRM